MPIMELMFNERMHQIYMAKEDQENSCKIIREYEIETEIDDILDFIENPNLATDITFFNEQCELSYILDTSNKKIYITNERGSIMELTILELEDIPINEDASLKILWYKNLPNGSVIWTMEWKYL